MVSSSNPLAFRTSVRLTFSVHSVPQMNLKQTIIPVLYIDRYLGQHYYYFRTRSNSEKTRR